jgi:hypothetical protein
MTVLSKMAMISTTAAMSTTCTHNETTTSTLEIAITYRCHLSITQSKFEGNIPATGNFNQWYTGDAVLCSRKMNVKCRSIIFLVILTSSHVDFRILIR